MITASLGCTLQSLHSSDTNNGWYVMAMYKSWLPAWGVRKKLVTMIQKVSNLCPIHLTLKTVLLSAPMFWSVQWVFLFFPQTSTPISEYQDSLLNLQCQSWDRLQQAGKAGHPTKGLFVPKLSCCFLELFKSLLGQCLFCPIWLHFLELEGQCQDLRVPEPHGFPFLERSRWSIATQSPCTKECCSFQSMPL